MKIRVMGLATLCLGLALTAVAQRGPRGGFPGGDERPGGGQFERNPLGRLAAALELNEAQAVAAEALLAAREESTAAIQEQLRANREGLAALIASRDTTAIGNAILAQHDLQEQLHARNDQFLSDFNNLLTSAQQEQFSSIREMTGGGFPGRGGPGMRGRGGRGPAGPGEPE